MGKVIWPKCLSCLKSDLSGRSYHIMVLNVLVVHNNLLLLDTKSMGVFDLSLFDILNSKSVVDLQYFSQHVC
jgi:type IV secretory pathway protease TraF